MEKHASNFSGPCGEKEYCTLLTNIVVDSEQQEVFSHLTDTQILGSCQSGFLLTSKNQFLLVPAGRNQAEKIQVVEILPETSDPEILPEMSGPEMSDFETGCGDGNKKNDAAVTSQRSQATKMRYLDRNSHDGAFNAVSGTATHFVASYGKFAFLLGFLL